MVVARRTGSFKSSFFGMEAKCLMTEHAFETLGLERINSYQSTALKDWQRWQILFGYKMEGIMRKAFRKGYQTYDLMVSGCLLDDYLALKALRGGRLWPGQEKIMALIRDLPKESLEEKLQKTLTATIDEHYAQIRFSMIELRPLFHTWEAGTTSTARLYSPASSKRSSSTVSATSSSGASSSSAPRRPTAGFSSPPGRSTKRRRRAPTARSRQ